MFLKILKQNQIKVEWRNGWRTLWDGGDHENGGVRHVVERNMGGVALTAANSCDRLSHRSQEKDVMLYINIYIDMSDWVYPFHVLPLTCH